jgi:hypothetical protein
LRRVAAEKNIPVWVCIKNLKSADFKRKECFMKKILICGISVLALTFTMVTSGCTSTNYLSIITPHKAVELLSDNVQVFVGATYDEAAVLAGEAGFEVILSYEGRNRQGFFGSPVGSVRIIAKDADGIRPVAPTPAEVKEQ